ncbi:MAG: hypothetical protein JF602_01300 [Gemmatimonadetes bacterium]|nr:hypothetical protein [Gemmatimonadota bacterium]
MTNTTTSRARRGLTISVGALLLASATACQGILDVENPGAIQEEQLGDAALQQLIVNGANRPTTPPLV